MMGNENDDFFASLNDTPQHGQQVSAAGFIPANTQLNERYTKDFLRDLEIMGKVSDLPLTTSCEKRLAARLTKGLMAHAAQHFKSINEADGAITYGDMPAVAQQYLRSQLYKDLCAGLPADEARLLNGKRQHIEHVVSSGLMHLGGIYAVYQMQPSSAHQTMQQQFRQQLEAICLMHFQSSLSTNLGLPEDKRAPAAHLHVALNMLVDYIGRATNIHERTRLGNGNTAGIVTAQQHAQLCYDQATNAIESAVRIMQKLGDRKLTPVEQQKMQQAIEGQLKYAEQFSGMQLPAGFRVLGKD